MNFKNSRSCFHVMASLVTLSFTTSVAYWKSKGVFRIRSSSTAIWNAGLTTPLILILPCIMLQKHVTVILLFKISCSTVTSGNGLDIYGFYGAYDSDRFSNGDMVQSIFIYSPDNNYIDDVVCRIDTLIEQYVLGTDIEIINGNKR